VTNPFAELNPPYSTIVADPPWHYDKVNPNSPEWKVSRSASGIHAHGSSLAYSSMSVLDIIAMPVEEIAADDARLYLWVTNRYLRHAWEVAEAWGFEPQHRMLVWCKKPRATTPVTTEFVLIAKRGRPPRMPWHPTTWFEWPLQPVHSQKPAAMFDLVESWSPGPYLELFARQPRLGWDSWGYGYEGVS
jgi:N6-adenosine-specific RNA methylase IME4